MRTFAPSRCRPLTSPIRLHPLAALLTTALLLANTPVNADGPMDHATAHHGAGETMQMTHSTRMGAGEHAAHMKMLQETADYKRSRVDYTLPDVRLRDANGTPVQLRALLATEQPVILNFIFTSCTTVCPILTATLAQARQALGADDIKPLLISISIDPQYDTPAQLRKYAARYHAGDNWHFLTGDLADVIALQRAFNAYYGTKMNHQPLTFLRRAPEQSWVRLQGFTSSADLVAEYRALFTPHH